MNGEAIYETRPWVRSEGKTRDGISIRFTKKNDVLYAILLGRPRSREIIIESLPTRERTQVQMLGINGDLSCVTGGENLRVTMPAAMPGDYAYVVKVSPTPV